MSTGLWYGIAAYLIWGTFPLYWKLVAHVSPSQLIAHRILWSFLSLVVLAALVPAYRELSRSAVSARILATYVAAATLIAINWWLYVWAVTHGLIVETSLGYFINPLLNVLLGVFLFRERLRAAQWMAVGVAAAGLAYLTITYGALPFVALGLALTFAAYGLIKKQAPLPPVGGLTLETGVLVLPALAYMVALESMGTATFLHTGVGTDLLMIGAGLITTLPLLLFAAAMQQVPLSTMGIVQYISPTMQFLLGVFVYREAFTRAQLIGFGMVWLALVIFTVDGLVASRVERT